MDAAVAEVLGHGPGRAFLDAGEAGDSRRKLHAAQVRAEPQGAAGGEEPAAGGDEGGVVAVDAELARHARRVREGRRIEDDQVVALGRRFAQPAQAVGADQAVRRGFGQAVGGEVGARPFLIGVREVDGGGGKDGEGAGAGSLS